MKTVFKSAEVAHVWAQQKQEHGKNAQGNFYFQDKTIFSYGAHFPIATFVSPGVVLLTTKGYSRTTSKHVWATHDAVRHLKVFEAPNVPNFPQYGSVEHGKNVEHFIKEFPLLQKAAIKARKDPEGARAYLVSKINYAVEYAKFFKKSIIGKTALKELAVWKRKADKGTLFSEKEVGTVKAVIKEETAAAKIRNAERRKMEAERAAQRAIDDARRAAERARTEVENLALWLKGETVNTWALPQDHVRLRIKENEIQTTRGASIPLSAARTLWDRITSSKPVHGLELGNYTVTSFDGSALIVGCHNIPMKEVFRMAKKLGWSNGDGVNLEVLS